MKRLCCRPRREVQDRGWNLSSNGQASPGAALPRGKEKAADCLTTHSRTLPDQGM